MRAAAGADLRGLQHDGELGRPCGGGGALERGLLPKRLRSGQLRALVARLAPLRLQRLLQPPHLPRGYNSVNLNGRPSGRMPAALRASASGASSGRRTRQGINSTLDAKGDGEDVKSWVRVNLGAKGDGVNVEDCASGRTRRANVARILRVAARESRATVLAQGVAVWLLRSRGEPSGGR
eukprot:116979-Prorocentrum_minimum.AAC.5